MSADFECQPLLETQDATEWAKQFIARHGLDVPLKPEIVTVWFQNAFETGRAFSGSTGGVHVSNEQVLADMRRDEMLESQARALKTRDVLRSQAATQPLNPESERAIATQGMVSTRPEGQFPPPETEFERSQRLAKEQERRDAADAEALRLEQEKGNNEPLPPFNVEI